MKKYTLLLLLVAAVVFARAYTVSTTVSPLIFCAGSSFNLAYTTDVSFSNTNYFTAQLSDATGSFANPVIIGSRPHIFSATIPVTIPAVIPQGTSYRIRVVASAPAVVGADNGVDITILSPATPTITVSGSGCLGSDSLILSNAVSPVLINWYSNGVLVASSASAWYKPVSSGLYTANYTTSACSSLISNALAFGPTVSVSSSAGALCTGTSVTFSAAAFNAGPAPAYQWYVNGSSVGSSNIYNTSTLAPGDSIRVVMTADNGCATVVSSTQVKPIIYQTPAPPVLTVSGSGCLGKDSLMLSGISEAASINWFLNGSTVADSINYGMYTPSIVAGGNGSWGNALNVIAGATGVYVTDSGYIYASDQGNKRVMRFPPNGTWHTMGTVVAGGNGEGLGLNQFKNPGTICRDKLGYTYLADIFGRRVLKFPPNSTGSTNGIVAAGDITPGGSTILVGPHYICLDDSGYLYVSDQSRGHVKKFPPNSVAGTPGTIVTSKIVAGIGQRNLYSYGIAVDKLGNLYVADHGNMCVLKFPAGSDTTTPATIVAGGNWIGDSMNELYNPSDIEVDAYGNLYVLDEGNFRIQRFPAGSTSATNAVTVLKLPYGSGINEVDHPTDFYIDKNNDIYIADGSNFRIKKYTYSAPPTNYAPANAGSFNVGYTTASGCQVTSNSVVLNAVPVPSVTATASQPQYCTGTIDTFKAVGVNGGVPLANQYQWYKNGNAIAGATSDAYITSALNNNDSLWVTMLSNMICADPVTVTSNKVYISLFTYTPAVSIVGKTSLCAGVPDTITATPVAGGVPSYQWYKNGIAVGTNDSVYIGIGLSANDSIWVVMTSGLTCVNTPTATSNKLKITGVYSTPSVTGTSNSPVLVGDTIKLSANQVAVGSYKWAGPNGFTATIRTPVIPNAAVNMSGVYVVTLSNLFGCKDTSQVNVVVGNGCNIALNSTVTNLSCYGANDGQVTATATSGNVPYRYKLGLGGTWQNNGTFTNLAAGAYTIYVIDTLGCSQSAIFNISQPASVLASVNITGTHTLCNGAVGTYNLTSFNGGIAPTYQWYKNGVPVGTGGIAYTSNTTYNFDSVWVVMTSNAACANPPVVTSNKIFVTGITHTPHVDLTAAQTAVCVTNTANTFTATGTDEGTSPIYTWYKNNVLLTGINGNIYNASSLNDNDSIWVVMTSNATCLTSASDTSEAVHITVGTVPAAPTLSITGSGCSLNDTLMLSGATGSTSVEWYLNGVPTAYQLKPTIAAGANDYGSAANQLGNATGVYLDKNGYIYASDNGNSRIQMFPPGSSSFTDGVTRAGGIQSSGAAGLHSPGHIFISDSGYIYVADVDNDRIQKFPPNSSFNSPGVTVAGGYSFDGSGPNELDRPMGVCVDKQGYIYVADYINNRIQKFPPNSTEGSPAVTVAGGNGYGNSPTQLGGPWGIFLDSANNLYVADSDNHRVQKFPAGSTSSTPGITIAGDGVLGGAVNRLNDPASIFVDANGSLYVADRNNGRIVKFPPNSTSGTNGVVIADHSDFNYSIFEEMYFFGSFNVVSIYVDSGGVVYAADKNNNRIVRWVPDHNSQIHHSLANGSYTATYTTAGGCTSPMSNAIVVNGTVPVVTISATYTALCNGMTDTFTATVTGGGTAPAYTWYKNGVSVANSDTYVTSSLNSGDSVWLSVTGNSPCGNGATGVSNKVYITVGSIAPSISASAVYGTICAGVVDTFHSVALNAGPAPAYRWFVNGSAVQGATAQSYYTNMLNDGDSVWVEVTSSLSCASPTTSLSNKLAVAVNPVLPVSVSIVPGSLTLCAGSAVTFTATGLNAGVAGHYEWYRNGIAVGTDTSVYNAASLNDADSVWVELTSSEACAGVGQAVSNVVYISASQIPNQQLCLVTIDTAINKPVVIWEKVDKYATDTFYIFRTVTPGTSYIQVAAISRDSLSSWTDSSAQPELMSYRYRIGIRDTCGNYSALSLYHQTMYLTATAGGNFSWTPYIIENSGTPISSTIGLYRDDAGTGNWQLLTTVSGSQTNANDTGFYLYPNAHYKVVIALNDPCDPTRSVQFISSNTITQLNTAIAQGNAARIIKVYPNPVNSLLYIYSDVYDRGAIITVTDASGKLVFSSEMYGEVTSTNTETWSAGVYFCKIAGPDFIYLSKIVKE